MREGRESEVNIMREIPTIQDCMDMYEKRGLNAIVNDGIVIRFEAEKNSCEPIDYSRN